MSAIKYFSRSFLLHGEVTKQIFFHIFIQYLTEFNQHLIVWSMANHSANLYERWYNRFEISWRDTDRQTNKHTNRQTKKQRQKHKLLAEVIVHMVSSVCFVFVQYRHTRSHEIVHFIPSIQIRDKLKEKILLPLLHNFLNIFSGFGGGCSIWRTDIYYGTNKQRSKKNKSYSVSNKMNNSKHS